MDRTEAQNISENQAQEASGDKSANFLHKYIGPDGQVKKGVKVDDIFGDEEIGYKKTDWDHTSSQHRSWISVAPRHNCKGLISRYWEMGKSRNNFFYTKEGNFYLGSQKTGEGDFEWFHIYLENGKPIHLPLKDVDLSGLAKKVAKLEIDKQKNPEMEKGEVAEQVREKARKNLRPWEKGDKK